MKPTGGYAIVFAFHLRIGDRVDITLSSQLPATGIAGLVDNEGYAVLTGALERIRRWIMLGSYRVYDADAHVILAPAMWEDLPEKYVPRRPRPATFTDSGDMAAYTSGWLIEGRV